MPTKRDPYTKQACELCRQKKLKCVNDASGEPCDRCQRTGSRCFYDASRRKKRKAPQHCVGKTLTNGSVEDLKLLGENDSAQPWKKRRLGFESDSSIQGVRIEGSGAPSDVSEMGSPEANETWESNNMNSSCPLELRVNKPFVNEGGVADASKRSLSTVTQHPEEVQNELVFNTVLRPSSTSHATRGQGFSDDDSPSQKELRNRVIRDTSNGESVTSLSSVLHSKRPAGLHVNAPTHNCSRASECRPGSSGSGALSAVTFLAPSPLTFSSSSPQLSNAETFSTPIDWKKSGCHSTKNQDSHQTSGQSADSSSSLSTDSFFLSACEQNSIDQKANFLSKHPLLSVEIPPSKSTDNFTEKQSHMDPKKECDQMSVPTLSPAKGDLPKVWFQTSTSSSSKTNTFGSIKSPNLVDTFSGTNCYRNQENEGAESSRLSATRGLGSVCRTNKRRFDGFHSDFGLCFSPLLPSPTILNINMCDLWSNQQGSEQTTPSSSLPQSPKTKYIAKSRDNHAHPCTSDGSEKHLNSPLSYQKSLCGVKSRERRDKGARCLVAQNVASTKYEDHFGESDLETQILDPLVQAPHPITRDFQHKLNDTLSEIPQNDRNRILKEIVETLVTQLVGSTSS
eukprot:CAMPEP_0117439894 /NCGR_PEP_ID=MMETSP0759-20121206/2796_1 /TAXON_ID=63605 /ORGANISM="Percolomonas cosmopolitus, Strain WS" /LENGTH=622 /DNA_ID=CAMNT_0005231615 /DNA_START=221 /DNA_END=2086 /DNA_ORIENTATION=-